MKLLLTILLLWGTAKGQTYYGSPSTSNATYILINDSTQSVTYDTIPFDIRVRDTTKYYIIYNSKGKKVKEVTGIQPYTIPVGGSISKDRFVNPDRLSMVGFVVFKTDTTGTVPVIYWNAAKQPVPAPFVVYTWDPVDGYNLKDLFNILNR